MATFLLFVLPATAHAGSVKRVHYAKNSPSPMTTFFDRGGLQLRASCQGFFPFEMDIEARSKGGPAMIHANSQGAGDSHAYFENDSFDAGETLDLGATLGADNDSVGQIIFAGPGGKVVTIDWAGEEEDGYGEAKHCVFVGTARVLKPGSSSRVNFRAADLTPAKTILDKGGLRLRATCDSGAGGLILTAHTKTDNASIYLNTQGEGVAHEGASKEALNTTDTYPPFAPSQLGTGANDSSSGQIVYARPGGDVVTVDWAAEVGEAFSDTKECAFVGTARHRKSGDPKRVNYRQLESDDSLKQAFKGGGLTLNGLCDGDVNDFLVLTSKDHALFHADNQASGALAEYIEDDNLNRNEKENFFSLGLRTGQIVYSREDGTDVTVDWASSEDAPFGGTKNCAFVGTAEVAEP